MTTIEGLNQHFIAPNKKLEEEVEAIVNFLQPPPSAFMLLLDATKEVILDGPSIVVDIIATRINKEGYNTVIDIVK